MTRRYAASMPPHPEHLLIVTPHSSGQVSADILRDMLGDAAFDTPRREAFLRRVFMDGDPYTDLIYALPGARHVHAPWSRFAVDLNRDRTDTMDNGVIKLMDFSRQPLYPAGFTLSPAAREDRLRRIWDTFDALVAAELDGAHLMIVGHCMAPTGPALGEDTGRPRPAFCLMPGTPQAPTFPVALWPALQHACETAFQNVIQASAFRDVRIGEPWATDTLSFNHHARSGVPAFGIEVNAGLYLRGDQPDDTVIRALNAGFEQFTRQVLTLL